MPDPVIPNSLEDYYERLCALVDEAKSHGIDSVAILVEDSPLGGETVLRIAYNGNFYAAIGALESAKLTLLRSEGT